MADSDHALLTAWGAGDRSAGSALVRRHSAAVVRFFRNKVSADLEDLVQQTFLGLLEARSRFRGDGSFRSYLFGIAYRVLAAYYRARYRLPDAASLSKVTLHDLSPSPSLVVAERREVARLHEALRRIPVDHQIVLEMHYWEEMTTREIANALEIPHGTAMTRLARARVLLSERLATLCARDGEQLAPGFDVDAWARSLRSRAGAP